MKYDLLKSSAEKIMYSATRLESFSNKYLLEPYGLSVSSYKILHIIHEFKVMSPSDILHLIGGTKSNVTQRINYLIKKNFVKKMSDNSSHGDKRKTIIKMTEHGLKKYHEIQKSVNSNAIHLDKIFTPTEKKHFDSLFKKLILIIDKYQNICKKQKQLC